MNKITFRTAGHSRGGITRLASPGDLGQYIKPFVFLDLFDMAASGAKMGMHPHSGIATVTVVMDGALEFRETTGRHGVLPTGGVEWMSAGGGVWHTGGALDGGRVRGFQLWLALPPEDENSPAQSLYLAPEQVPAIGPARVIIGSYDGAASLVQPRAPITYLHVKLNDGQRWTYTPPEGHDVSWLAVADGALLIGDATVQQQIAVFEDGSQPIHMTARGAAEFVIGSAAHHPYPLVTGYYSVHTSADALRRGEAEIERIGVHLKAA
jgi:redox-sensitive bicupin YhaK (pirin superfamily)